MQLQGPWISLKSPWISIPKYSGNPGLHTSVVSLNQTYYCSPKVSFQDLCRHEICGWWWWWLLIDAPMWKSLFAYFSLLPVMWTTKCTEFSRDGRIVIFCRIPDSVNRRLISGRFQIRIRIFDVTSPLVYTYKKLQQIASNALFFCNL